MLLLLCRCYDYRLKTEDVLELTRGDRTLALETVVGVLEDGETYATELVQRARPASGQVGQWEHELVTKRHEKPLILQTCRLLKGFTSAPTYFADTSIDAEITLHEVDGFTSEVSNLLAITLKSRLVEKLALALHDVLFSSDYEDSESDEDDWDSEDEDWTAEKAALRQQKALRQLERGLLDGSDHKSICAVFAFLQNLYSFAGPERADVYRQHLLADTLLVPRLVLPYLNRCVAAANLLSRRAEVRQSKGPEERSDDRILHSAIINNLLSSSLRSSPRSLQTYDGLLSNCSESKEDAGRAGLDNDVAMALDDMNLVAGCAAALRVLIIASFRAPPTRFVLGLLRRLNPTASLLRAAVFVARHDYLFALLCLLNVNMGALDLSVRSNAKSRKKVEDNEDNDEEDEDELADENDENLVEAYYAHSLLHDMASVHAMMDADAQQRVMNRVLVSGALPVSRDTSSFAAVKSMLEGGSATGQASYVASQFGKDFDETAGGKQMMGATMDEDMFRNNLRAEAKHRSSVAALNNIGEDQVDAAVAPSESKDEEKEDIDEEERARRKKERKDKKKMKKKKEKKQALGLLGDLPSLDGKVNKGDRGSFLQLDLELPQKMKKLDLSNGLNGGDAVPKKGGLKANEMTPKETGVPSEFACAINGHLMKEPVRTPGGIVFEKDTILLWIKTRGQICPISGDALSEDMLEEVRLGAGAGAKRGVMGWVWIERRGSNSNIYHTHIANN